MNPYAFDAVLPAPSLDEPLGTGARHNLRRAIRTAEKYRAEFPQHADSILFMQARILPAINRPTDNGLVGAIVLVPATMRPKASKRHSRPRSVWACLWRVLRGR